MRVAVRERGDRVDLAIEQSDVIERRHRWRRWIRADELLVCCPRWIGDPGGRVRTENVPHANADLEAERIGRNLPFRDEFLAFLDIASPRQMAVDRAPERSRSAGHTAAAAVDAESEVLAYEVRHY